MLTHICFSSAVILLKNIKAVDEDRVKMVKQSKSGKFQQAVAELDKLSPPTPAILKELEESVDKKGKKGGKRQKEESATATNGEAKKAKVKNTCCKSRIFCLQ